MDEQALEKQKAHFEKARRGVVRFIVDKGGQASLDEMHDFSLNRYLIQHQGFSRLLETLVDEKLVEFDFKDNTARVTEAGRRWLAA